MFVTALWALEQERKFAHWIWRKGGMSRPGGSFHETPATNRELGIGTFALLLAGVQTGAITSMGYSTVAHYAGKVEDFMIVQKLNEPVGFSLAKGKITPKFAKISGRKLLAAKVASRFIPYVGWALFATDVYLSGKWIKEHYF